MQINNKIISPAALNALKEALANIYWTRRDLRRFVYHCIDNKNFVPTIDWEQNSKLESCSQLIDRMSKRQDIYLNDLFSLLKEVSDISDFSHLNKWEDAELKIQKAKESVKALRIHTKGFFKIVEEENIKKEKQKVYQQIINENKSVKERLAILKQKFIELSTLNYPQKRGFKFERFLNELFNYFDLDPKSSYKLDGEQIDGAFTFDSNDYLLEAKWTKIPMNASDLKVFAGTVAEKSKNTLGLFISMSGFSLESLDYNSTVLKSLILMDGADLYAVLDDRISLIDLLFRKRRYASETGNIFLPIKDILL